MRRQILEKRKELDDLPPKPKSSSGSRRKDRETPAARPSAAYSDEDDKPKAEKLSLKKKGIGSEARAERIANADADLQLLGEAERGRHLQKQKKQRLQGHEDEVLSKLEKFKTSFWAKPMESTSEDGCGGGNEDLSDCTTFRLKFTPETGKDRMSRKEDPNDYIVVDPLLEKGKEKFNRMQAKEKRLLGMGWEIPHLIPLKR